MTAISVGLPGRDFAAYLQRYPQEVTFGADDPVDVFDRYHTPDFVMINDGVTLDRERLLAHVHSGRRRAAEVQVTIRDVVSDGDRVAARYVLTAVMQKGQVIPTEIFMFGHLAPDGRLHDATQLTRSVASEPIEVD